MGGVSTKNVMPGKTVLQKWKDECIPIQNLREFTTGEFITLPEMLKEFLQLEMNRHQNIKTCKSINSLVEINIEVKVREI